jgi:hypothetical protein
MITRQHKAAVTQVPPATSRFSQVHINLVGPLPTSPEGYSYLLTAVDRSTHWLEAWPLRGITTADCRDAFIAGWVEPFGVPSLITSDRGVQFAAAVWATVMSRLGIKHTMTTEFLPQANGLVKHAHHRLKKALKARAAMADWPSHLPWVLLGLRAAPREDSGISAAEMMYGAPLTLPGPMVTTAERFCGPAPCHSALTQPFPGDSNLPPPTTLMTATHVYVRSPAAAPALSPAY